MTECTLYVRIPKVQDRDDLAHRINNLGREGNNLGRWPVAFRHGDDILHVTGVTVPTFEIINPEISAVGGHYITEQAEKEAIQALYGNLLQKR